MLTPSHWKSINLLSVILSPLGWIYGLATLIRQCHTPQKVKAKVICVGNLTAGGTGKTPVAVSIAQLLQQQHKNPFFITRGYGGKLQDIKVSPQQHQASDVGDEPLLLARQANVIVNKDRVCAAQKAISDGADILIMDDGFQNPGLYKDKSFLVIDGQFGFGNELCIPAGPLREFLHLGIKRADALIILGKDCHNISRRFSHLPIFYGTVTPIKPTISNPNIIAFAGIGRPEKFYNSLKECGFNLLKTIDFPDHHFYQKEELQTLIAEAHKLNALLYTTAKDFVKIPPALQKNFQVLEITISWQNPQELTDFLLA